MIVTAGKAVNGIVCRASCHACISQKPFEFSKLLIPRYKQVAKYCGPIDLSESKLFMTNSVGPVIKSVAVHCRSFRKSTLKSGPYSVIGSNSSSETFVAPTSNLGTEYLLTGEIAARTVVVS